MKKTVTLILSSAILFSFANFESDGIGRFVTSIKNAGRKVATSMGVGKSRNAQQAINRIQQVQSNLTMYQGQQGYVQVMASLNDIINMLANMINTENYSNIQQCIMRWSNCMPTLQAWLPNNPLPQQIQSDLNDISAALGNQANMQTAIGQPVQQQYPGMVQQNTQAGTLMTTTQQPVQQPVYGQPYRQQYPGMVQQNTQAGTLMTTAPQQQTVYQPVAAGGGRR